MMPSDQAKGWAISSRFLSPTIDFGKAENPQEGNRDLQGLVLSSWTRVAVTGRGRGGSCHPPSPWQGAERCPQGV